MSTTKLKPTYKTEKIKKDDGSIVEVTRVALADQDTCLDLLDKLLHKYILADGAIGEIITDEELRSELKTLCSLLPIVNSKSAEQTYLDFDSISDNWEQLITLFFNGALNEDTREVKDVTPSRIGQLHFFPFLKNFKIHLAERTELENKEKGSLS